MSADREAALAMFSVPHETVERIDSFLTLLQQWQTRTNLVANSALLNLWTRHVADSLQLLSIAPHAATWLDIGSGGGFPGIVLACAVAERPGPNVHLVERNGKKAAFLREALRVSKGVGQVHRGDIRDLAPDLPRVMDVVTARALAPLETLLEWSAPWLRIGAVGLFPKGEDIADEIKTATISWDFAVQHHASRTGPGTILEISNFRGKRPAGVTRP